MDVVTLGESMVLFTPEKNGYMRYAQNFTAKVAGAESNVAIGLARLGHKAGWISRLGKDEFGKKVLNFIRGEGVDVSCVTWDAAASTGLYFKEVISSGEINVHYFRKNAAASLMTPSMLDEDYIKKAKFLHITGITPALSSKCRETVMEAIKIAKQAGVSVIFDPNLRRKLWDDETAKKVLLEIAAQADIVLPGMEEGAFLFGKCDPETMAKQFLDHGAKTVVLKLGEKGAYYVSEQTAGFMDAFPVSQVIDPVGAGDGFAAGLLSGLLDGLPVHQAVERAAAVGAMVTMIAGDVEGLPEREKLLAFMCADDRTDVNR